jgi:hypothetical protein
MLFFSTEPSLSLLECPGVKKSGAIVLIVLDYFINSETVTIVCYSTNFVLFYLKVSTLQHCYHYGCY